MSRLNTTLSAIVAAIALSGCFLFASAQMPTLAERVKASHGEPLRIPPPPEILTLSIDELSAHSDLVVTGKLVQQRSYVSEDGVDVLTDYQIVPRQVLVARTTSAMASPGQTPPMVLVLVGGEVVIDGIRVTMGHSVSLPPLGQAEFLIFAKATEGETNRFELIGQRTGLFELQQNGIRSLQKGEDDSPEITGVPFDKIVAKIRAATSK